MRIAPAVVALCVAGPCIAAPRLEWDLGETRHPVLGNIAFATNTLAVETPVGARKVTSRAYLSCEKAAQKMALELANATGINDPGGLQPKEIPRLLCTTVVRGKRAQAEIPARWAISELGDVLARGFAPASLRQCASIEVQQEVILPKGWGRETARIAFEIAPSVKELGPIFSFCGEDTSTPAVATAAAVPAPAPAATPAPGPSPAELPWKAVRTIAGGRTNVRAQPSTASAVVIQLAPGALLQAQPVSTEWWRVKPASGKPFVGYVRDDRLEFR
ncbi:MAG TPA: SH3 domain-containing protein [Usitatibacter sp.]|nr:SH3 domain-containing protein [Usitatibacter sp.]